MTDLQEVRRLAGPTFAALEASRRRIDDLNVYPVPDGDTGTNLTLTVRAVKEALEQLGEQDRERLAHEIARAALMGARGNSGVILSQIVRGFADVLGGATTIDSPTLARAFRSASDVAYRAVRRPVEGTMLTVIRELAEEAEAQARADLPVGDLLRALVHRGEDAVARTPQYLEILREAGVVDAGGAGLLELLRGLAAAVTGDELPEAPPELEEIGFDAVHQELSRYRYCTVFVVEGQGLDAAKLEAELDRLGDSLMVVGDEEALKVHVHTDDPGAALSLGVAQGVIEGVEIADMHRQTQEREARLLELVPDPQACEAVAVVAGDGNARLFRSLGATRIVEGGQSMNPSTAEILGAVEAAAAPEVVVLPNNSNVILSAEQAAEHAQTPVRVVQTRSIPAGIAAMVAFDGSRSAEDNAAAMEEAAASVVTGAVTTASRDVALNGFAVRKGAYLGLSEGEPVAGGDDFEQVAEAVVEDLLAERRGLLTILAGEDAPALNGLLDRLAERHPELEVDVQEGGSPTTTFSSRPNSIERVPIRIVLIEDNDVFREALELLLTLNGEIEVVGAAASGSRAVDLCRELSPDVLLVDYRLPGLDGVQVTRTVRKHCPAVAVVALTAAAGEREIKAMLDAGAVACVRKDEPLDAIAEAVRAAAVIEAG